MIRKEAWPFYSTISGVRRCWELEERKGPKGLAYGLILSALSAATPLSAAERVVARAGPTGYRGTSLIRNRLPLGPYA